MNVRTTAAFMFVLLVVPTSGYAQPILTGITRGLSSPQTNSFLVDIDPLTGLASNPRDTGLRFVAGIATQPSTGILFGLTAVVSAPNANSLFRLDVTTGVATLIGTTGLPQIAEGELAFNPNDGMLYGVQEVGPLVDQRSFFRINPTTGSATVISNFGPTGDFSGLAFDSVGTLYMIDDESGGGASSMLHTVNPVSGVLINSIPLSVDLQSGVGFTFDPITGIAYVADGGPLGTGVRNLYTLDVATGSLNVVGPLGIPEGVSGLTFVSVPEPSALFLLTPAIIMISRRMRVRRICPSN